MNKICSKCGLEKPINEFVKNKTKKDGYTSYCKECHRKTCRAYYLNNKQVIRKHAKIYQNKMKDFVNHFKKGGCILCGEKDLACLDLHHLRDKKFTISSKITDLSKDTLKEEIDKCVVLCANCHRKLHYYHWQLQTA